jgi:FG-GAP-like repeat/FG-GAP repeat
MKFRSFVCLLPLLTVAFGQSNSAPRILASVPTILASAPAGPRTAPVSFDPAVAYSSGGIGAMSVAVADLNGDGTPDLVVANWCILGNVCASSSVAVLLGKGNGTFRAPMTYSSGGVNSNSVAVADVNGDGKPDLVVVNVNSGTVAVLLGKGNGTFQPAVTYGAGGAAPISVAVADINNDGNPDLLVAIDNNGVYSSMGVLLGNGNGTFQPAVTYNSGGYSACSVAVADVNGDGKPDVVVANLYFAISGSGDKGSVGVLLGNGDGTFQPAVTYSSGAYEADSVAVADINNDGKLDVLVANQCADAKCAKEGTIGVLLGNGDGTFQAVVNYPSGGYWTLSVAVADVNGDGIPDLVAANDCATVCENNTGYPGSVGVLLGKGNGTFSPGVSFGSGGYGTRSAVVADLNGDGNPDVVVANCSVGQKGCGNQSKGTIGVLINTSAPTAHLREP